MHIIEHDSTRAIIKKEKTALSDIRYSAISEKILQESQTSMSSADQSTIFLIPLATYTESLMSFPAFRRKAVESAGIKAFDYTSTVCYCSTKKRVLPRRILECMQPPKPRKSPWE